MEGQTSYEPFCAHVGNPMRVVPQLHAYHQEAHPHPCLVLGCLHCCLDDRQHHRLPSLQERAFGRPSQHSDANPASLRLHRSSLRSGKAQSHKATEVWWAPECQGLRDSR